MKNGCDIEGCKNETWARGLCRRHWHEAKSTGRLPPTLSPFRTRIYWTEELTLEVITLYTKGNSTRVIAETLTRSIGQPVSKNAIIGKLGRQGYIGAQPRSTVDQRLSRLAAPFGDKLARPGCLWPQGHPGEEGFHFCGDYTIPGKSYCAQHAGIAYRKVKEGGDELAVL